MCEDAPLFWGAGRRPSPPPISIVSRSLAPSHHVNTREEMIDIFLSSPPGLWYHSTAQTALKVNYQAK